MIKSNFQTEIAKNDPRLKELNRLRGELELLIQPKLFPPSAQEKAAEEKKLQQLPVKIAALEAEIEEIKNNKIYENSFEWRFEFPEVLDDDGNFVGFDVVIGNPPYVNFANLTEIERTHYRNFSLYKNKTDLFAFFVGLSSKILGSKGILCLIIPHTWISTTSFYPLRKLFFKKIFLNAIVELDFGVFKDAYVKTVIIHTDTKYNPTIDLLNENFELKERIPREVILKDKELKINLTWNPINYSIYTKIKSNATNLGDILRFSRGIKTSNDSRFLFKGDRPEGDDFYKVLRGRNIKAYKTFFDNEYIWYRPDLMKEKVGSLPHTKELFLKSEKIITQRVNSSGLLLAAYDVSQYFCLDTTNVSNEIIDQSIDLKFIVGLMNSRLINWWFNDEFKNPTISGYELHQIPIKRNRVIEEKVSKEVEKIIYAYSKEESANLHLSIIDSLIYTLYELTDHEVSVVERSFT